MFDEARPASVVKEFGTYYNSEIEPALQQAGHGLDERLTYQDLLDVCYGGIQYALQEYHDMRLTELC